MDRTEQIFNLMKSLAHERFKQSRRVIEEYCQENRNEIAAGFISAFKDAFTKAAHLQKSQEKGKARYLVLSHIYSSVWIGGYSIKLDIFDKRFYADPIEIDAYLRLDWLHNFLSDDMGYFRKELIKQYITSIREYELEQIKYRYLYYYHSVALELISGNMQAILCLPEFLSLKVEPEFEILFGGYMDKAIVIWSETEDNNEVFSA